MLLAKP